MRDIHTPVTGTLDHHQVAQLEKFGLRLTRLMLTYPLVTIAAWAVFFHTLADGFDTASRAPQTKHLNGERT